VAPAQAPEQLLHARELGHAAPHQRAKEAPGPHAHLQPPLILGECLLNAPLVGLEGLARAKEPQQPSHASEHGRAALCLGLGLGLLGRSHCLLGCSLCLALGLLALGLLALGLLALGLLALGLLAIGLLALGLLAHGLCLCGALGLCSALGLCAPGLCAPGICSALGLNSLSLADRLLAGLLAPHGGCGEGPASLCARGSGCWL